MRRTKEVPVDIKQECLWIVRGYRRRVRDYQAARREILLETPCRYQTMMEEGTGQSIRVYLPSAGGVSRTTEDKLVRLDALEAQPETKRMRAVEWAKSRAGAEIANEESRARLVQALLLNCESGRKFPFEKLNLSEFSRMDFYRRKAAFLADVATYLKLL